MTGPLTGIKILDLSRVLAGPYCTQMLADLGAEVWKLESFSGDDTRRWGPPFAAGESAYYLSVNRGKKSLAVDLKSERGQALVRQLAAKADIVVENFKVGDLARYGLDYSSLATLNPKLIYCSITGFGQTGDRANEPGYDAALQGLSGIMSVTGEADGAPVKIGVAWIDVLTGLHATVAILAALHERQTSDLGQHLDISLFDCALASLVNQAQSYLLSGAVPQRLGSSHPQIVPYGGFEASDDWLMVAVGNDVQYQRLCTLLRAPELWEDTRYQSNAGRVEHRAELLAALRTIFKQQPRELWLTRLNEANIPATPVNTIAEALADPQVEARGMLQAVSHSTIGDLPLVGSPFQHFSRTPAGPVAAPPLLGENSASVLRELLGLSAEEIADLERTDVIKTKES